MNKTNMNMYLLTFFSVLFLHTQAFAKSVTVEKISYDLDEDGKPDSILLSVPDDWDGPGEFSQIDISIGNKAYTFKNEGGWDSSKETINVIRIKNALRSSRLMFHKFSPSEQLIMAIGYPYSDAPNLVSIYNLAGKKVTEVFNKELELMKLADLDKDGRIDLVGKGRYSESTGQNCMEYFPYLVYTLRSTFQLNAALTEKYNLMMDGFYKKDYIKNVVIKSRDGTENSVPEARYLVFKGRSGKRELIPSDDLSQSRCDQE